MDPQHLERQDEQGLTQPALPSAGMGTSCPNIIDTDGTAHQAQLGLKPRRTGFFSPPDSLYAAAVHQDAQAVEYSAQEEVCVCPIWLGMCCFPFNP